MSLAEDAFKDAERIQIMKILQLEKDNKELYWQCLRLNEERKFYKEKCDVLEPDNIILKKENETLKADRDYWVNELKKQDIRQATCCLKNREAVERLTKENKALRELEKIVADASIISTSASDINKALKAVRESRGEG